MNPKGQAMKTKKLKNLVKKAKEELTWQILEEKQASGPLRIFSDSAARTHTIFQSAEPPEGDQYYELSYLHELGHALLCERVHQFFSSGFPVMGLDTQLFPAVSPVLNTASDWFVGHWMMDFCHDVAMEELQKEFEATAEMMRKAETPDMEKFFVSVLIIAQSKKYLKAQVECSGFLDTVVQAFLAVPPEKPSLGNIEVLINSILSLGTPYQCRHRDSEGQDVMEFYRVDGQ
jgi:hypothetical protein